MIEVRTPGIGDLDAIAEMARQLARSVNDPAPRLTVAGLREAILGDEPWCECFIAESGVHIVGYILGSRYFEAHTAQRELRISDLYVMPAARNAGVGMRLFRTLLQKARELKCDSVAWEVWKENEQAYRFYERAGAQHLDDVTMMRLKL